jgi:hypothetical protein
MDPRYATPSLSPSDVTPGSTLSSGYTHPLSTANKRRSVLIFGSFDLPSHQTCAVRAAASGATIALSLWEMEESTPVSIWTERVLHRWKLLQLGGREDMETVYSNYQRIQRVEHCPVVHNVSDAFSRNRRTPPQSFRAA